jgi:hypothetical protein
MSLPPQSPAVMPPQDACVRCGHTRAYHGGQLASCTRRMGLLHLWRRCPCEAYVPPGVSPETADQDPNLRFTA